MTKSRKLSNEAKGKKSLVAASRDLQGKINKTWNAAPRADMFTRPPTPITRTDPKTGEKVTYNIKRRRALLPSHAYQIAVSGAAEYVAAIVKRESAAYRLHEMKQFTRSPWLPQLTAGAQAMLEFFLCAYAQEATLKARTMRVGLGLADRLNAKTMRAGFDAADAAIFGSTSFAPRNVIVAKLATKKAKNGGKPQNGDDVDAEDDPKEADD